MFFASFRQGELDRYGNPMDYNGFIKEFEGCIIAWKHIDPEKFTYRITLEHPKGRGK